MLKHIINDSDFVIDMDAIDKLGGVTINHNHVQYGKAHYVVALQAQGS